MFPLFVGTFAALMSALIMATSLPVYQAQMMFSQADVTSANLLQYQSAVVQYVYSHPTATGVINDASLTFSPGYIRNTAWTNIVSSGQLYVYSTSANAMGPQSMSLLFQRSGNSPLVGTASASFFVSMTLGLTSLALPAAIPNGAVVIIGT